MCATPVGKFPQRKSSSREIPQIRSQALRHEHDLPGEVALEERPRSRARVLEPPRPDPGLKPKDRGRMGNNVRIEKVR